MSQNKSKDRITLLSYDPIETPEEIIEKDKDNTRKEAFLEANKRVAMIIPEYFKKEQKKKRKNSTSGGTAFSQKFSQNIVITPEEVVVQAKEVNKEAEKEEKEIGD